MVCNLVNSIVLMLSFDDQTVVIKYSNIRGSWVKLVRDLSLQSLQHFLLWEERRGIESNMECFKHGKRDRSYKISELAS